MKKMLVLLIVILLTASVVGCGENPNELNEDVYDIGCKVVDICEEYLDTDIDAKEAADRIGRLDEQLEGLDVDLKANEDLLCEKISLLAILLDNKAIFGDRSSTTDTEIKKELDEIKESLGIE